MFLHYIQEANNLKKVSDYETKDGKESEDSRVLDKSRVNEVILTNWKKLCVR